MRFTFIGIYDGKRYTLPGDGVRDITGAFISFNHETDYDAIGAARQIQKWVGVPDGSPFRHYFEAVEIHIGDNLIAEVRGKSLYRYSRCMVWQCKI